MGDMSCTTNEKDDETKGVTATEFKFNKDTTKMRFRSENICTEYKKRNKKSCMTHCSRTCKS